MILILDKSEIPTYRILSRHLKIISRSSSSLLCSFPLPLTTTPPSLCRSCFSFFYLHISRPCILVYKLGDLIKRAKFPNIVHGDDPVQTFAINLVMKLIVPATGDFQKLHPHPPSHIADNTESVPIPAGWQAFRNW